MEYNEPLSSDIDLFSARALAEASSPYVEKYWGSSKFHLGKIRMELNADLRGMVYTEFPDSLNGSPRVVEMTIDTINKKIVKLSYFGKSSKIDPGIITLSDWKVDSQEAIILARNKIIQEYKISEIDAIDVNTNNTNIFKKEFWNIIITSNAERYFASIDTLSKEIKVGIVKEFE